MARETKHMTTMRNENIRPLGREGDVECLAALLESLEAAKTSATIAHLPVSNWVASFLRRVSYLHSAADVSSTSTTTQVHVHLLLGTLSCLLVDWGLYLVWMTGGSHHHTGCSVTTRSVVGAAGLVGCSAVIVLAFHVRSGAASCLEDLNQLKTPSPNILKCDGVVDMWKCLA